MKTLEKLNLTSFIIIFILGIYILLVLNDNPISWSIPEEVLLCLPLLFLIPLGLSIASLRISKNTTAIIAIVISVLCIIPTSMLTLYLMSYQYGH